MNSTHALRLIAVAVGLSLAVEFALMWRVQSLERTTLKLQSGDIIVCSKMWQGKSGSWMYSCINPKGEPQ